MIRRSLSWLSDSVRALSRALVRTFAPARQHEAPATSNPATYPQHRTPIILATPRDANEIQAIVQRMIDEGRIRFQHAEPWPEHASDVGPVAR